jgi:hypothetical protein
MLRLWEWERLRDLPVQVDLWLPEGSDFLYAWVRVRDPHERPAPVRWWSNVAVPEDRRIVAPADAAGHHGYERGLRRVPGRPDRARSLWGGLPERARRSGAFRLLEARLLLAEGRKDEARAVFDAGFEVADLSEGAEILGEVWARLTDEPLPYAYEFRMRPS